MGYGVTQENTKFAIKAGNLEAARTALNAWDGLEQEGVDADDSLVEVLQKLMWPPTLDGDGNITGLDLEGERNHEEDVWFNLIAPFVEKGSYIEMCGEDMMRWRWYFDGKRCIEQSYLDSMWQSFSESKGKQFDVAVEVSAHLTFTVSAADENEAKDILANFISEPFAASTFNPDARAIFAVVKESEVVGCKLVDEESYAENDEEVAKRLVPE